MGSSGNSAFRLTDGSYRPDIDGLRGLAVMAVVAFHAFPSVVPGGFVGVDVFFVISGYLISGIIFDHLSRETFSFREFYYRRIKRIFPALIVMLIGCLVLGWLFLLPLEFRQVGSQVLHGAGFVLNFKFWHDTGYFDAAAEMKPLLHLWSLAVEEQFYIAWPLLLWAAWKSRFNLRLLALGIAALSFASNIAYVHADNLAAAFYSPASRLWELMLGAMLALGVGSGVGASPRLRDAQSLAGLAVVGLAVAIVSRDAHFPGWWALLPTVGTVLMIRSGPDAWLNRAVLSHPAIVSVGLISYPLYLWHWPLLSMARIIEAQMPPLAIRIGFIILSVALAWLTYETVEKPIRYGKRKAQKACAALGAVLLAVGLSGASARGGFPPSIARLTLANQGEIAGLEDGNELLFKYDLDHFYLCTPHYIQKNSLRDRWPSRCLQSKPSEVKQVAIIGDSHAEDLFVGLAERLKDANVVSYIQSSWPLRSVTAFAQIYDYVERDSNIRSVILASYWNYPQYPLPVGSGFRAELAKTVGELVRSGKTVYLVEERPDFPFHAARCKYTRQRLFWLGVRERRCGIERSVFDEQRSRHRPDMEAVAAAFPGVHLIDMADVFCDDRVCRMAQNGLMLYRDQNHLTMAGSRAIASRLAGEVVWQSGSRRATAGTDILSRGRSQSTRE